MANEQEFEKRILTNSICALETSDYYDERWPYVQTDRWPGEEGYGFVRVRAIEAMMKRFIRSADLKILDLGCGTGWLSRCLSQFGAVTGVDFSADTLEYARQKYGLYGRFVLADPSAPTLGLPTNEFDLVVASEVIEHVLDQEALVYQISLLLRSEGWLILTTPNRAVFDAYMADVRKRHYIQPVENWLLPSELAQILRKHNFTIRQHEGFATSSNFGYNLPSRVLGHRQIRRIVDKFCLHHLYGRILLPFAMYQLLIARKTG